jgi:hypothetical protein
VPTLSQSKYAILAISQILQDTNQRIGNVNYSGALV